MIDYKLYFHDILRIANDGKNIKLCLIKRTSSDTKEKSRIVLDVDVEGDVIELFRDNLVKNCNSIITDNELVCDDFFSETIDNNVMSVINEEDMISVETLHPLITNILKDDETNKEVNSKNTVETTNGKKTKKEKAIKHVTKFNKTTISNLLGYAVSTFIIVNGIKETCVYFKKYNRGSKISKGTLGTLFQDLKTGKFSKVNGDVFKFDEGMDAVYYERRYLNNSNEENIKIMFVDDINNFEEIFSFEDFYKRNAESAYKLICAYSSILIEKDLYEKFISNKNNLRKICKLNKKNIFSDIDFDRFYGVYEIASLNYKLDLIIDNKIIQIGDKNALCDFLDICDSKSKLFSDIMEHNRILKGMGKELPKKQN